MRATVRRQGAKMEVEDKHASFILDGQGSTASGRVLVMGKDMSVCVEIPADALKSVWAALSKHFNSSRKEL